jgi:ribosomal protein S18 acetylase RimI-like enzyme
MESVDIAASKAAVLRGVRVRIPPRALNRFPAGYQHGVDDHGGGAQRLSGEVVIRPAQTADAEAIARLHVAAWRAGYTGIVPDRVLAELDPDRRAAAWRELIPDTIVLLASYDGAPAGFTSLAIPARDLHEPATGEITTLYVDPELWRRGIARALVDAAAAELRDDGCDEAVLWVYEANAGGRAFYAAVGFHPDGARKDEPLAGQPEIRLRARLD